MKKILWSILCIVLISGKKWCHPNKDKNETEVTKKRVGYTGDTKESKKYGCICTCCHADDLIFLRNNYNFDILAVANALSKRHSKIRHKEFICKPCHKQLKDGKYSNIVHNCVNSDLFGSNLNHVQDDEDKVHGSRTHNENNMTCDFSSHYTTSVLHWKIAAYVHIATKLIYQDHNVSSSKNQSTTLAMLLFKKHYLTDSQFLHPRHTVAKNVKNIF